MSEWKEFKLSDVTEYINRGVTPSYSDEGVIVINQKCVRDGQVKYEQSRFTNPEKKKIPLEKFLKSYDILINSTGQGTLGRVGQVKNISYPTTVDSHLTIVRANKSNDPVYLGYVLKSKQKAIEDLAEGTTGQTELSRHKVAALSISLPGINKQKIIAEILSSLDDKIELNNKINQELESLAKLLFKRWFVDFEFPNENGEPYKSSGGEMVDSELGEIPKGWVVDTLEKHINIINGFAFKSEDYASKGYKIIRTKNFNEKGFLDLNDLVFLTETDSKKYSKFNLQLYDKLVVMVGASIGKSVIVTSNILPALQNQNMWNFRAKTREFQAYSNFLTNQLVEQNIGSATGSAREFFRKDFFYSRKILVPNAEILVSFGDAVFSMYDKLDVLLAENKELISLRDTLLPKLISGEIQINDN